MRLSSRRIRKAGNKAELTPLLGVTTHKFGLGKRSVQPYLYNIIAWLSLAWPVDNTSTYSEAQNSSHMESIMEVKLSVHVSRSCLM